MSEEFSDRKRRFVRLTEQELARIERWQLPEVGEHPTVDQLGEQLGFRLPQGAISEAEAEAEDDTPVSISVAELEEIRQAAYEEGLQQGLEEGRERGHAEGLQQGLEEGRQQGHEQGLEQGYQDGMGKADDYLAGQRQQLSALLDNLAQPASRLDTALLEQLRELACLLAEAVIYREVETSHTLILGLLKRGLETLPTLRQQIKVFVHPEDRLLLEQTWSDPQNEIDLVLISDAEQSRGNCRLVTETSQVEFNWQQRFAEMKAQLLAAPLASPEVPVTQPVEQPVTEQAQPQPSTAAEEPAAHELESYPVDPVPAEPAH